MPDPSPVIVKFLSERPLNALSVYQRSEASQYKIIY